MVCLMINAGPSFIEMAIWRSLAIENLNLFLYSGINKTILIDALSRTRSS